MALTYVFAYNELDLQRQGVSGGKPGADGRVTADASYPQAAGGYLVDPLSFHPTDCKDVVMVNLSDNNTHYAEFVAGATPRIQVFLQSTDAEVGDAVDLTGIAWNFTARMTSQ